MGDVPTGPLNIPGRRQSLDDAKASQDTSRSSFDSSRSSFDAADVKPKDKAFGKFFQSRRQKVWSTDLGDNVGPWYSA